MFACNDEINVEDEEASMALSNEEVRWARAVKAAALEDESLEKLSDYEYTHHALFTDGNVQKSIGQIEGLQQFREEYNITDTVEEGMTLIQRVHDQQPWLFLGIGFEDNCFVHVIDYAQLNPSVLRLPEDWRTFLGGFYYICHALTSHLRTIKEGNIIVGEIEGVGWKNFSLDFLRTYWEHFFRFYPIKWKEQSWVHNSVIGNIFESLHRSMFKERGQSNNDIRIGVINEACGDARLDALFKIPTPEIAWRRVMDKFKFLLTKRYQYHQSFHLPAPAPVILTEEDILLREAMEAGDNQDDEEDTDESSEDEPEEEEVHERGAAVLDGTNAVGLP